MALPRVPPQPALRHHSLAPAQCPLLQATAESAVFGRQFRDTLCDVGSYSLDVCHQDLGQATTLHSLCIIPCYLVKNLKTHSAQSFRDAIIDQRAAQTRAQLQGHYVCSDPVGLSLSSVPTTSPGHAQATSSFAPCSRPLSRCRSQQGAQTRFSNGPPQQALVQPARAGPQLRCTRHAPHGRTTGSILCASVPPCAASSTCTLRTVLPLGVLSGAAQPGQAGSPAAAAEPQQ